MPSRRRDQHTRPALVREGEHPAVELGGSLHEKVRVPAATDDAQRSSQVAALNLAREIAQTRWLIYERGRDALPLPSAIGLELLPIGRLPVRWAKEQRGTLVPNKMSEMLR